MSRGPDHRLDSWLHRSLFLAADEGVLQTRRTIPAGRRGAGSDAGDARPLSGRTQRRSRKRQRRMADGTIFRSARSAPRPKQNVLDSISGLFPDRLSRPDRLCPAGARGARALNERRGGMITLSYGNGRTIRVPKGLSVLEASLRHQVPHASVCGGRARCSTCRIRVIGDCSSLPRAVASARPSCSTGSGPSDPAIRLACQLRPETDLSFFQIFMPQTMSANAQASQPHRGSARSAISSACSWICAARPSSPKIGCRSIRSSSSTVSSARYRRP